MDSVMTNPDTLCEILARMPFADHAALACVSSGWGSLIATNVPTTRIAAGYKEAVLIEFHAEDCDSDTESEDEDEDSESEDEEDDDGKMVSTVTMVSQTSGLAKTLPPLPDARVDFATCNLEGRLYVIGGRNGMFKPLTFVHAYDHMSNTWATCAPLKIARTGASCTAVDGKIVVAGGWSGAGHLRSAEMYDPVSDAWTSIASMTDARAWAMAECVDGKVVVAGGVSVREAEQDENMPVDLEQEQEQEQELDDAAPVADEQEGGHEQEHEDDAEGEGDNGEEEDEPAAPAVSANISVVNTSVEIYDVATNRWSMGVELPHAISQAASFVSSEGTLVTLGGKVDGKPSSVASCFDHSANAWTDSAELPVAVAGAQAIRLGPNRVALVGGTRGSEGCDAANHDQVATMDDGMMSWSAAPWGRLVGSGENTTCAAIWV